MPSIRSLVNPWIVGGALLLAAAGFLFLRKRGAREESPGPGPVGASEERPVEEPHWGDAGKVAQQHVGEVRAKLERLRGTPSTSPSELAQAYGELGEVFLAYDIPASAIACFQNASRLDARPFRWPYLEALAHLNATDTAAAARAMQGALARMRSDPATRPEDLYAACCFLGDAAMRLNERDEARGYFSDALELNPNSVFARFKRGQLASFAGRTQAALDDLLVALASHRGEKPAVLCLAVATELEKLGRREEGAKYRRMAGSTHSTASIGYPNPLLAQVRSINRSPLNLNRAVEAELARGNFSSAIARVDEALSQSPDSLSLRMLRAEALLQGDEVERAIAELEEIRRRDSAGQTGRGMLLEAYARRPETHERALEEAQAWRDERPSELRPQMTLGAVCLRLGRYEDARGAFETALKIAPHEIRAGLGKFIALCALKDYDGVVTCYDQLSRRFKEDQALQHHFARFLATCPDRSFRDPPRSLMIVTQLAANQPSAVMRETMACALAASGKSADATKLLDETVSELGESGALATRRRLHKVLETLKTGQLWLEPWPFAEIPNDGQSASP